jgi:UDP-GlcNAc:undecaprenyl-phosphate/decaprenyl-phosphate GlcNAc-1-phosphate transferase
MIHALYPLQDISVLALVFFLSLFLSLVFTPLADRMAKVLGIVDHPCERKVHTDCISRLGGVAMAIPLILVVIVFAVPNLELAGFLLGAGVIFVAGFMDDKIGLSPKIKFLLQILAVVCFIITGRVYLMNLGDILGFGPLELGIIGPVFTVIAMTGVINSFNLSDGLDGLAAGMAGIACLFFIPFAHDQGNWVYLVILTSLLGVILGFLRFNSYPATLFMGDSGSFLLGFVMASSAIVLTQPEALGRGYLPVTALIIISLPVADTLYVMAGRMLKGNSPVLPDKTHIHHRLMAIGLSHQLTVSGIYCFMLGMGVMAWIIRPIPEWFQFYITLGIYIGLYLFLYLLEQKTVRKNKQLTFNLLMSPSGKIAETILFWTAGKSREFFVLFWVLFMATVFLTPYVPAAFRYYLLFVIAFGLFFYPWRGGIKQMGIAHGVIFFGLYSLVLAQNISFEGSSWFQIYMFTLSALALVWTIARVINTRRIRVLWPGSFEILLLGMAMVTPIILHYSVFFGYDFRWQMWISFLQVVPFLLLNKAFLRRSPARIRKFAGLIMAALIVLLI